MIGIGPFIPHPHTPLGSGELKPFAAPEQQVPNSELMVYKAVALTRLVRPDANIPSTTALATINKRNGRELGLQRGANVLMPNLTPVEIPQALRDLPGQSLHRGNRQRLQWLPADAHSRDRPADCPRAGRQEAARAGSGGPVLNRVQKQPDMRPKSEGRNSKAERRPKSETRNPIGHPSCMLATGHSPSLSQTWGRPSRLPALDSPARLNPEGIASFSQDCEPRATLGAAGSEPYSKASASLVPGQSAWIRPSFGFRISVFGLDSPAPWHLNLLIPS